MFKTTVALAAALLGSGCATITTELGDPAEAPNGVRVYPPKVYMLVDTDAKKTDIVTLPDVCRPYDVRSWTVFAKHDFKIELADGQLKTLTSNEDTTAFLTFLSGASQLAAKAAGVPVSKATLSGTYGLDSGVYVLDDGATFRRIGGEKGFTSACSPSGNAR